MTPAPNPNPAGPTEDGPGNISHLNVLLVEDNPADARFVEELLHEAMPRQATLTVVTRLANALQHLAGGSIDTVLLDLSLPDAQGLEGLTQLRMAAPQVPIVIMSGHDDETLAVQGVREGAQDYLVKGRVDGDLLRRALSYAVERQRSAEALQALTRELARSNADLEQFAAVAAHDLRSPLFTIAGYTDILRHQYGDRLDADANDCLDAIGRSVTSMTALISDLLAYARAGTETAPPQPTDCAAVVQDVLAALRSTITQSGATITVGALPVVQADPSALLQLFQNLIGNALAYCGEMPPEIHVEAQAQGSEWLFAVRDNGIGLDPADAARIFGLFTRLRTGREHPGSGLGLAICQRIVERHGGRIWVESQPGQGATFFFTLPTGIKDAAA